MTVTGGYGVRMQWDYVNDTPGLAGSVSAAQYRRSGERWLRLTRSGAEITGYDSADGAHWTKVAAVRLPGLPGTVLAGLFAATPGSSGAASQSLGSGSASGGLAAATGMFDHVTVTGAASRAGWAGSAAGDGSGYRRSGDEFTMTGSGDIAPVTPDQTSGSVQNVLVGAFAGLIAVVVVATMFITGEYRRGLIRLTLMASPRRAAVLGAKALVIGTAAFAVALPACFGAWLLGEHQLRSGGISILPVPALTQARMIIGTAALLAVTAVLALAVGVIVRRGAIAITIVMAAVIVPYFFASPLAVLPAGAADWLLRVTPAAGFAIQQAYPRYPQVAAAYTPMNGYYPLAPWAGFAVLCAWTAVALGAAGYLLHRTDA